jgi:hypothetical protein
LHSEITWLPVKAKTKYLWFGVLLEFPFDVHNVTTLFPWIKKILGLALGACWYFYIFKLVEANVIIMFSVANLIKDYRKAHIMFLKEAKIFINNALFSN